MRISETCAGREEAIIHLFTASFTASEGAAEGALIGDLARKLLLGTAGKDLHVFTADGATGPVAAAIFTRLAFARDGRTVLLLSPMAVAPGHQRRGVGQALLRHALARLRAGGVDVVMTYGDPAFYGKVGFRPVSETTVPAPLPLSRPEGWIGQALTRERIAPFAGPCSCAPALHDPVFW